MNKQPTVYFISGIGADKRAFRFLDLGFCNPVFVDWVTPLPHEHISSYAARIKKQITEAEPVIVGLSFGGMVGAEIARQFPVKKLILLSSAKTEKEIPCYLRWLRYFPLHKIIPVSILKKGNQIIYKLMGIEKRKDKLLFQEMFDASDNHLIRWSINQIIHWRNNHVFPGAVHIHGTADILLPRRFVRADYDVKGGEHLMVIKEADTVSRLLKEIILKNPVPDLQ